MTAATEQVGYGKAGTNSPRVEESRYRLGELEHLLEGGTHVKEAMRRTGWSRSGLDKQLAKHPDLGRRIRRMIRPELEYLKMERAARAAANGRSAR